MTDQERIRFFRTSVDRVTFGYMNDDQFDRSLLSDNKSGADIGILAYRFVVMLLHLTMTAKLSHLPTMDLPKVKLKDLQTWYFSQQDGMMNPMKTFKGKSGDDPGFWETAARYYLFYHILAPESNLKNNDRYLSSNGTMTSSMGLDLFIGRRETEHTVVIFDDDPSGSHLRVTLGTNPTEPYWDVNAFCAGYFSFGRGPKRSLYSWVSMAYSNLLSPILTRLTGQTSDDRTCAPYGVTKVEINRFKHLCDSIITWISSTDPGKTPEAYEKTPDDKKSMLVYNETSEKEFLGLLCHLPFHVQAILAQNVSLTSTLTRRPIPFSGEEFCNLFTKFLNDGGQLNLTPFTKAALKYSFSARLYSGNAGWAATSYDRCWQALCSTPIQFNWLSAFYDLGQPLHAAKYPKTNYSHGLLMTLLSGQIKLDQDVIVNPLIEELHLPSTTRAKIKRRFAIAFKPDQVVSWGQYFDSLSDKSIYILCYLNIAIVTAGGIENRCCFIGYDNYNTTNIDIGGLIPQAWRQLYQPSDALTYRVDPHYVGNLSADANPYIDPSFTPHVPVVNQVLEQQMSGRRRNLTPDEVEFPDQPAHPTEIVLDNLNRPLTSSEKRLQDLDKLNQAYNFPVLFDSPDLDNVNEWRIFKTQ